MGGDSDTAGDAPVEQPASEPAAEPETTDEPAEQEPAAEPEPADDQPAAEPEPAEDVPAAEANHDVIVQRIADENPDLVYSLVPELMAAALIRAGIDIPMITSESDEDEFLNLGVDPNAIQLHVFAAAQNKTIWEQGNDPLLIECVDNYNNAQITDEDGNVELVNVTEDPNHPINMDLVVRACQTVQLFAAIATAAGPNLTNETFLEAAANLGSIDLPGMTAASISEGKIGADDSPMVKAVWDPDEEEFVPAG